MSKNLILILAIVLTAMLLSVLENNIAVINIVVLFIFVGHLFSFGLFRGREKRSESLNIFLVFFYVYSLYAYVIKEVYITDGHIDYFIAIDSTKFFSNTEYLLQLGHLKDIFNEIQNNYLLVETRGYYFISVSIGYLSNIIGHNSYYIQLLVVTFITALIPTTLYNLLSLFFANRWAIRSTYIYGALGYIFAYSANLLRDNHISLFFLIGFYLYFREKSFKGALLILFLAFIISTFRIEHGAFFVGVSFVYLYSYVFYEQTLSMRRKLLICLISIGLVTTAIIKLNVFSYFDLMSSTTNRYTELSIEDANEDGLGSALLNLPPVAKHLARTMYSQILPFPIESGLVTSRGIIKGLAFPLMISGFFWFLVWCINIVSISDFKKLRRDIKILSILCFIFLIFAASASGDFRRLMAIYPIFYLLANFFFVGKTVKQRIMILIGGTIVYVGLHLVYIILKM